MKVNIDAVFPTPSAYELLHCSMHFEENTQLIILHYCMYPSIHLEKKNYNLPKYY